MFQILKWLEENLSSFEYFRKNTLTTCFRKAKRNRDSSSLSLLIRYNTHAPWITTSTIQTNRNHHRLFVRIPILGHILVHSVDKTHVLVVTVELIWLLLLSIYFSILFRRNYLNRTAVILTNHCQSHTAFLLQVRCSKLSRSFFLQLFVPNEIEFA